MHSGSSRSQSVRTVFSARGFRSSSRASTPGIPSSTSSSSGGLVDRFLAADRIAQLDRFERTQLAVCLEARSLSEAGRRLFSASRTRRTTANDADRLRKYLARFGLSRPDLDSLRTQ